MSKWEVAPRNMIDIFRQLSLKITFIVVCNKV